MNKKLSFLCATEPTYQISNRNSVKPRKINGEEKGENERGTQVIEKYLKISIDKDASEGESKILILWNHVEKRIEQSQLESELE